MFSHYKDILSNGLSVVTIEIPHLHVSEVVLYVRCGSRFETTSNNGISHFLEHMLLRGSKNYPSPMDMHRTFENIGGELNGVTSGEYLYLYYYHHPSLFEEGIRAFSDVVKNPIFNDFEIEKKIIVEEILSEQNTDGEIIDIDTIACELLWPDNNLSLSTLGFEEKVLSFEVEDVNNHFKSFFTPSNMVLCCGGKVEREAVVSAAQSLFGDLRCGERKQFDEVKTVQKSFQSVFVNNPEPKTDVQICFRGTSYNDPTFFIAEILKRIFSDGVSSRLNYSIREKLGLVYDISAQTSPFYDTGTFDINFSVANANLERTISAVLDEILKLIRCGILEKELILAKKRYLFDLGYSVDSPFKMCCRFGWAELFSTPLTPEEEADLIKRISAEEVERMAGNIFRPENFNIVVVGPAPDKKSIRKLIESFCSDLETGGK